MTPGLKTLLGVVPLAAVGIAEEARAEAADGACPGSAAGFDTYYDPCGGYEGWTEFTLLSGGTIPTDGVLVLQAAWRGAMPDLESAQLTVETGGVPLAGALEPTSAPGLVVWRPAEAWATGETYAIGGAASNVDADGMCLLAELSVSGEVTIGGASEPLAPVEITAMASTEVVPTISLKTLACCPGVTPTMGSSGCGGESFVDFDPTQCAPIAGVEILNLTLTGTTSGGEGVEQQLRYLLRAAGQPDSLAAAPMFALFGLTAAQCATIDTLDLGTGEVVPGVEGCFGAEFTGLGPTALDPAETLACAPQQCAVAGDQWDLEMCAPYGGSGEAPTSGPDTGEGSEGSGEGTAGEDDDAKGCACAAAGTERPPMLALVGLVWLARRRRRA